jgi:hypothetical protein
MMASPAPRVSEEAIAQEQAAQKHAAIQAAQAMQATPPQAPGRVAQPNAIAQEGIIQPHEMVGHMDGDAAQEPQGALGTVMDSTFGAAAPVPKCEDEFCQGCLFCKTSKSSSCGYPIDDKAAGRNYIDDISLIRKDRGEDWNMNYAVRQQ